MRKYDDIDIETGAVLRYDDAIGYLKYCAEQLWERAVGEPTLGEAVDTAKAEWEDLVCMAQVIRDEDWEWVLISEHPMSASGIHIEKMIMANA